MAARTRRRGQPQNLDSLLDTLANVTGILVMLLVVSQISVGDAMGRLRERLLERPELSREALSAAEREAQALHEALAPLLPQADALRETRRRNRAELSELTARATRLDAALRDARGAPLDASRLSGEIATARGRVQALERSVAEERAAIAALEQEIAALPARPPGQDLRVPLQRPTPPGAREVTYLVRYGRLLRVDAPQFVAALHDGAARATGGFSPYELRANRIQQLRVIQFFETHDIGNAALRWRVRPGPGGHLFGEAVWRPDVGESEGQLAAGSYRADLLRLRGDDVYLHFFVWEDSFDVYRKARAMADDAGFAAGWAVLGAEEPIQASLTGARGAARSID